MESVVISTVSKGFIESIQKKPVETIKNVPPIILKDRFHGSLTEEELQQLIKTPIIPKHKDSGSELDTQV